MTSDSRMFTSLDEEVDDQERITFGDNSKGKVQGLGKVEYQMIIQYQMWYMLLLELQPTIRWSIV